MLPPDEARRALAIAVHILSRYSYARQVAVIPQAIAKRQLNTSSISCNVAMVPLEPIPGADIAAVSLPTKHKSAKPKPRSSKVADKSARPRRNSKDKTAEPSADSPAITFDVSALTDSEKKAARKAARLILSGQPGMATRVYSQKKTLFQANLKQEPPENMSKNQLRAWVIIKTNAQLDWAIQNHFKTGTGGRMPKPQSGAQTRKVVTSALLRQRAEDAEYQAAKKEVWAAEKSRRFGTTPLMLDFNEGDAGVAEGVSGDESGEGNEKSTTKTRPESGDAAEQREVMLAEQSTALSSRKKKKAAKGGATGGPPEKPEDEDDLSEEEPELLYQKPAHLEDWAVDSGSSTIKTSVSARGTIRASDVKLLSETPDRHMVVARLRSNLTGIPFSPGIHFMQDPRTGVYNFDSLQLQSIPKPEEFAYDRVAPYNKPSTHGELAALAQKTSCTYAGSTSTLTKAFSQIYFLISGSRPVNLNSFSTAFSDERAEYTFGCQLPACLEVTKNKDTGIWYVDNDKSVDGENVLSEYGTIMEKMLTMEPKQFAKLLKANDGDPSSLENELSTEAFYYQHGAKLMMRSQLDCYDPRLPGTGVFDIKTRACLPIRHDRANWVANSVYEITDEKGYIRSFEREDYDMLRATMLKYSMQARIGAMDGIFVAYHNTAKIFGFKYLPLSEIDEQLFGSTEMAESAFRLCVALFEGLLDEITRCFPGEDRLNVVIKHFTGSGKPGTLAAFVQPKTPKAPIKGIYLSVENSMDGEKVDGVIEFSPNETRRKSQEWSVDYQISTSADDATTQSKVLDKLAKTRGEQIRMLSIAHPEGKTPSEMRALDVMKYGSEDGEKATGRPNWIAPNTKQLMLRQESKDSARDHKERMQGWKKGYESSISWTPVPTPTTA